MRCVAAEPPVIESESSVLALFPVVTGDTGGATDWRDDVAGAETDGRAACVDDAAAVDCVEGCTGGRGAVTAVDGAAAADRTEGCTGGRGAVTAVDGAAAADRTEGCTDGRGAETGCVCATAVDGVYG